MQFCTKLLIYAHTPVAAAPSGRKSSTSSIATPCRDFITCGHHANLRSCIDEHESCRCSRATPPSDLTPVEFMATYSSYPAGNAGGVAIVAWTNQGRGYGAGSTSRRRRRERGCSHLAIASAVDIAVSSTIIICLSVYIISRQFLLHPAWIAHAFYMS